jgi:DNA-binding GntR family transcriptional regulator
MTSSTTTQTVADKLRTDVVSGHFPPNMRLIEAQLTERYETGRASVRSAIVELVKEGLLTREVNRGATVRMIEQIEMIEMIEMIEIYEARTRANLLTCKEDMPHSIMKKYFSPSA